MNLNLTNKLFAIICGLIFLPLTLLAQNKIVAYYSLTEGPASYHDVENYSALTVTGESAIYTGTNITLTATRNPDGSDTPLGHGAYITNRATLVLTDSAITTTGNYGAHGIYLINNSSGTLNNVNIKTTGMESHGVCMYLSTLTLTGGTISTADTNSDSHGVCAYSSTLTLTGCTITTSGLHDAYGIYLINSSGTLNNVNIETTGVSSSRGVLVYSSTLTLTGGTITPGTYANGIALNASTGTVSNVNIKVTGMDTYGVYAGSSSTLTLTDSDITAIGPDTFALYIDNNSAATASLNHNTITGGLYAATTSTLNLTGSNGTVITGDVISEYNGTVTLTLSGSDTKLIGNATLNGGTINLNIEDGTRLNQLTGNINTLTLQNGATLSSDGDTLLLNGAAISVTTDLLTLSDGTLIDYNDNALSLTGTLTIGDNILIDLSDATLEDGQDYLVLDWSNATLIGDEVTVDSFTATNLDPAFEITLTVNAESKQLTFNATAIPEPSVYILLGIGLGILLLTARRRNVQS